MRSNFSAAVSASGRRLVLHGVADMDSWANRAVSPIADGNRVGKRAPVPVDRLGEQLTQGGASSYPRELEGHVVLDDGVRLRMRPVRPDDEARFDDLYSRLSERAAYQRFFTFRRRLPSGWYHYFANVDYRRRLALVAERDTPNGPELVGVGRYPIVCGPFIRAHLTACVRRTRTRSTRRC